MIIFETTIAVDFENEDYKGFVRVIGTGYDETKISEDEALVAFKEKIFNGIEEGCIKHFSHLSKGQDIVADAIVTVTIEKNGHWLDTDEFPIRYAKGKVTAVMDDDEVEDAAAEDETPEIPSEWKDIYDDLVAISKLPKEPATIQRKPDGFIFDEEKSVRWNREKVLQNNARYDYESALLHNTINHRIGMMIAKTAMRIVKLSGYRIDYQHAEQLWRDVFNYDMSFVEAFKFVEKKIKELDTEAEED